MDLVWREQFRIRFYEAEPSGRVAVPALCRYLQEAADCHCRSAGISMAGLRAEGRFWVLTRMALRFTALPMMGEDVGVETWGTKLLGGLRAYRDFRLLDCQGQTFAEASSVWLLLDAVTHRPVRLPDWVLRFRHPERATPGWFDAERLPAPERPCTEQRVQVRWRDLDVNGHANNVCYVEWALETVPLAVRRDGRLATLDIQFLGEAFLDQEVVCAAEADGSAETPCFRHSLRANGNLLAVIRTEWAPPAVPTEQ